MKRIVLSGGVAANSRLRLKMEEEASGQSMKVYIPSPFLCTDNAAMVGVVGYEALKRGMRSPHSLNAFSTMPL